MAFPRVFRGLAAAAGVIAGIAVTTTGTQDANANGETRALTMLHAHTNETLTIVYKQNGSFDSEALKKLNWFLRDWRVDEPISMAPQLFDVIWYVYREVGASAPIRIMSAYRSPGTNAMLRRRSRAVAKESQHMRGNAMDVHIPGVSMGQVREIGMRLQRGGVGYYPSAGSPFVHLDVGSVRSWPRMPRPQLERLFPDGKTVHLPADGIPLANYQAALAEVQARGGSALDYDTVTTNRGKSLWALLFGGDEDEDAREVTGRGRGTRVARGRVPREVAAVSSGDGVNAWGAGAVAAAPVEVRPTPPVAAPVTVAVAALPAAPAARPALPEPKQQSLEIASLPVPPIRPRGARFESLVASVEPVPPIRPGNLETLVAALLPTAATSGSAGSALAFAAAPGAPLPPARPAEAALPARQPETSLPETPLPETPVAEAPALALRSVDLPVPPARPQLRAPEEPAARANAALPGILARPAEEPALARAYAAISAPVPPSRPAANGAAAPLSSVPAAVPPRPSAVPAAVARRTDPRAVTGTRPAAAMRPAQVTAVAEPPVEREVKRSVFAMSFSQGPAKGGSGSGGFGGSFIRPMGLSFSTPGE